MATTKAVLAVPGDVNATSLKLPLQLKFEEWANIVRGLNNVEQSVMFWIGDAFVYGEARFNDQWTQVMEETGYTKGTINNAMYVSRAIEPERRREELRYGHHYTVASLEKDEQDKWLSEAVDKSWSGNELKRQISASRVIEGETGDEKNPPQRDSKLLQAAKNHSCIRCGNPDPVCAHYQGIGSDQLGKGMGQKPHDIATAFLCTPCHEMFDQYEDPNGYERGYDFLMLIVQTIVVRMESDELVAK